MAGSTFRHLKLLLGPVYLCRLRNCDSTSFPLKVADREQLSAKKLSHVDTEADILSMLDHPFLPTLYGHFTASHYTCLLIDYCPGGDLDHLLHRRPNSRLPLQAVRFFVAEVLITSTPLGSCTETSSLRTSSSAITATLCRRTRFVLQG